MIVPGVVAALLVVLVLHLGLVVGSAYSVAWPNPFRRWREYEADWIESRRPIRLAIEEPEPFEAHLLARRPGRPAVLLCHGRSRRASWMLPLADALADAYDVCLFDLIHHGDRGYGTTTLSIREALDVAAVLDRLEAEGYDRIGLVGISIGGASAIRAAAGRTGALRALVSIGCFHDLETFLRERHRAHHYPPYLYPATRWLVRLLAGYSIDEVQPAASMARVAVPALVLHGTADRLVRPHFAVPLAEEAGGQPVYFDGGHDEPGNAELQGLVRSFLDLHVAREIR